jgi:hypothetical protein
MNLTFQSELPLTRLFGKYLGISEYLDSILPNFDFFVFRFSLLSLSVYRIRKYFFALKLPSLVAKNGKNLFNFFLRKT